MNFFERLEAVRQRLPALGIDIFLVPRGDEHLGEYVPASAERLAWLTGFTGSAGLAAVMAESAAVWSDGRYVLQLSAETDAALWERLHLTQSPPAKYLAARLPGARLGYDPWLISEDGLKPFAEAGLVLIPVEDNPVDAAWRDRPTPPAAPAVLHPEPFAGVSSEAKRDEIAAALKSAGLRAAVLSDPASIDWLLNIRSEDVACTPFLLGFALVHDDAGVELFAEPARFGAEVRAALGNAVAIAPRAALPDALRRLAGARVGADAAGTCAWFAARLREAGAVVVAASDPCSVPKARKNAVEQQGARAAHLRDGVAVCRFLHWLRGAAGRESEVSVAERLLEFRARGDLFRGASFPSIVGAGEHGAIIHYHASPATDRRIGANEMLLVDSGGQYADATTDITRTLWTGPDAPPAEMRDRFTRVLKGHIAIARLVFPAGVPGVRLDGFARAALWRAGLDYDHGTGHGVGSYLSVHEGPVSLSPYLRPAGFAEGMIVSNEPGFYLPGSYGIRIENLLLTRWAGVGGDKPFLEFETLTLAPFDRALIEPALLDDAERDWVDAYHARVAREIGPSLEPEIATWLERACAKLEAA